MTRLLERVLNLRPGDVGRGALLFFYLFLILTSYVMGKVARDALFLDRFAAVQLPYADIAIAVLVGFVVAAYVAVGRRVSLRSLLVGSQMLFASHCVLFWWVAHFHPWPWLYPLFYVWVGIFGVLAPAQVWTLANYVLTTREAKRVFGLVGSGAIFGAISGGFLSRTAVKRFGTESLMLVVAVLLVLCAGVVVLILRRRSARMAEEGETPAETTGETPSFLESLRQVKSSRYLTAIAAVICLSSFVTTTAGWQFKAIAKQFLVQKDALALFFGDFNFYAGILCLAIQLLLTSRLLRRFGIGPA
ncbi:MAG: Npt1/Npt2 family nucleotide transporter, partial [Terriglobales bacterium]